MGRKILIIRFSSMGDIILTTPVLRILKKQTDCEIHFLTKKKFSELIDNNPYVDKFILINNKIEETISELREENYDIILDFHRSLRSYKTTVLLRKTANRVNKLTFRKWLFVKFKIDLLPEKHMVDRYIETISDLNVQNDGNGMDYFLRMKNFNSQREIEFFKENNVLALVLGAAHFTKIMPFELKSQICSLWQGKVVLIGGPDEEEEGAKLENLFPTKVFNTAGTSTIDQSAFYILKSQVVIASDTGMMHMSAALQKPIVLVWGSTHESFGMTPYYGSQSLVTYLDAKVKGLECNPCTRMGLSACPEKHFKCMKLQSGQEIVKKAESLVN